MNDPRIAQIEAAITEEQVGRLICGLLVHMRGQHTQAQLSEITNSSAQKISRWESGVIKIRWHEFLTLLEVLDFDAADLIYKSWGYEENLQNVKALLQHLCPQPKELLDRLQVSERHLQRIFKGDPEAYLSQIFLVAGKYNLFPLTHFLEQKSGEFKLCDRFFPYFREQNEILCKYPMANMMLFWMSSPSYRNLEAHQEGYFASRLGCGLSTEKELLDVLKTHGFIKHVHKKYENLFPTISFKMHRTATSFNSKLYWQKYCQEFIKQNIEYRGPKSSIGYYSTFSVSEDGYASIIDVLRSAVGQISQIIQNDTPSVDAQRQIGVINLDLIDSQDYQKLMPEPRP